MSPQNTQNTQKTIRRFAAACSLYFVLYQVFVRASADKQVCVFCGLQKSFAIISNVCGRWLAREQGAVSYIPLVAVAIRGLPKCESSVMPPRGKQRAGGAASVPPAPAQAFFSHNPFASLQIEIILIGLLSTEWICFVKDSTSTNRRLA